jgi:hypothetical protein
MFTVRREEYLNQIFGEDILTSGETIGHNFTIRCSEMINPNKWQISLAARAKAWVCGRSLSMIVESNPFGDMDVCLF